MKFLALAFASTAAVVSAADPPPNCVLATLRPFLLDPGFTACTTETGYPFKSMPPLTEATLASLCGSQTCLTPLEAFVWKEYTECIAPIGLKQTLFLEQFINPIRATCFKGIPPVTTPPPTTPAPTTPAPTTPEPTTEVPVTPEPTTVEPVTPEPTTKRPGC